MATPFLKGVEELFTGKSFEGKYKGISKQLASQQGFSLAALHKSLGAINEGYSGAQSALNQSGAYATKQLLNREKQTMAGNQQSLISRGLYDSTAYDAAQRGATADTNDSLANLNAQLAQLGSNIQIGKAQDTASVYSQIANSHQNAEQLMLELGLNTQYGKQGGIGNAVLSLIGGLFGAGGSNINSETGR